MKKILAFVLALVAFCFVAQAQEDEPWKVTDFKMLPTDLDAKVNFPVVDPNGKQCALIKIESPYSGFTFSTGTLQVMKAEQKPGEWWVYVQKGVRKITIGHAKGILREWSFPESIKEGTVYVMKLREGTSAEAAYSTAVAATTATSGFAVITSEPSGADVYIDDQWVGVTPFNKRYPMNTRLRVRCAKKMYHDDLAYVTVTSVKTEQHFDLRPAYGALHLTSEPSGANVFVDGEDAPRGVTPLTINELASGAVQVMLVKDLYAPIKQIVGIEDGRTTDYFVKMVPMYADITINALRGSTIKIDGVERGQSTFKGQLSEGLHEVEAVLAGHKTVKRSIDVVVGIPQTYALNPVPMYGTLVVNSEPFEAEVYIGGKSYGKTPIIVPDMLIGEYDVELHKSGYATVTEHIVVREGEESEIAPRLLSNTEAHLDKTFVVNGVQFTMVFVEGGTFHMGATSEQGTEAFYDEEPVHNVSLSDYLLGQTEVTQELWDAVMGGNISRFKGAKNPVEHVFFNDYQEFIYKLNSLTGQHFRLPTEAEWEYAARGGKESLGYKYSGSDNIDEVAWYSENSNYSTHSVATKNPNELGLYDMSGNVLEWCADVYSRYKSSAQKNPINVDTDYSIPDRSNILRGGSWLSKSTNCRVSFRSYRGGGNVIGGDGDLIGLRLALSLESGMSEAVTAPDYIENGVTLGKGIAILGDWNGDGHKTYLYWAPVNCGYEEVGEVNTDGDHRLGKLYQWGAGDSSLPYYYNSSKVVAREMYYDTATPSPWYNLNTIDGTTSDKWNNNQGPCPEGWRLPTSLEFKVLCAGKNGRKGWVSAGTYAGQSNTYAGAEFFGANSDKTVGKGVFFPAAESRRDDDGSALTRGSLGYYWSSTPNPNYSSRAYYLYFFSSGFGPQDYCNRAYAFSVRCVRE